MELWRELLIKGLENENEKFDFINDEILKSVLESTCYKVLLQVKQTLDNEKLSDEDCFFKIENILQVLEENKIFLNRHDFL